MFLAFVYGDFRFYKLLLANVTSCHGYEDILVC